MFLCGAAAAPPGPSCAVAGAAVPGGRPPPTAAGPSERLSPAAIAFDRAQAQPDSCPPRKQAKEAAIEGLCSTLAAQAKAAELRALLAELRPLFAAIPKATVFPLGPARAEGLASPPHLRPHAASPPPRHASSHHRRRRRLHPHSARPRRPRLCARLWMPSPSCRGRCRCSSSSVARWSSGPRRVCYPLLVLLP